MKNYEEMAREVLAERDRILAGRAAKRRACGKYLAAACGICAVCCFAALSRRHPELLHPLPEISVADSAEEHTATDATATVQSYTARTTLTTSATGITTTTVHTRTTDAPQPPTDPSADITMETTRQSAPTQQTATQAPSGTPQTSTQTTTATTVQPPATQPTTVKPDPEPGSGDTPAPTPPICAPTEALIYASAEEAAAQIGSEPEWTESDILALVLADGFLLRPVVSDVIGYDDETVTLHTGTVNEDPGIFYYLTCGQRIYQVTVYYTDPDCTEHTMSGYLLQRFGRDAVRELTVNGCSGCIATVGAGSDLRYQGHIRLDAQHYITVRTAAPESELTEFLQLLSFEQLQLTKS